jgi:hypothetical protein
MALDMDLLTKAVNAGVITGEQYVQYMADAFAGTMKLSGADRKLYDEAIKATQETKKLGTATEDTSEAMKLAIGPATNLMGVFYGIAGAAITAAQAILAVRQNVQGFGELKMNVASATEALQEQMLYWQLGGEEIENTMTIIQSTADIWKTLGAMTDQNVQKFNTATDELGAYAVAIDYFMGKMDWRAVRDFAKENEFAAEAMGAVAAQAVNVGEMSFDDAARAIAKGLQIPLDEAKGLIEKFQQDATFSVTSEVIVQIKAVGDLWALGLAAGGGKTVNFITPFAGPNPYQYGSPQGPGFAQGADFIVPGGYAADTFPMYVSSGERVTVTPASKVAGDTYYDIQINSMPSQSPSEIANSVVWRLNEHQRLSRAAGAGYAGY